MRKLVVGGVLAGLALAMTPSHAAPREGTIVVPTAGNARAHRCAYNANKASSQGVLGYTLTVTAGKSFTLRAKESLVNDFDIAFYTGEPAACEADANAVTTQHRNKNHPDFPDEAGRVPAGARTAIVHMFAGARGTFVYNET